MNLLNFLRGLLCLAMSCCASLGAQELTSHHLPTVAATLACHSKELACANAASPAWLADGTLAVVWTAGGAVSVAKSRDGGRSFGPRVEIAEHQKNLDTGADARAQIIAHDDGHVLVVYGYFKDTQWNAKVNFSLSTDFAEHFTLPKAISKSGDSERFPVLGLQKQGVVSMAWVDKRVVAQKNKSGKVALGGSIAYTQTSDWGQTFKKEIIINPESCECCRIGLAIDSNDRAVLAYRALFAGGVRDHAIQSVSDQYLPSALQRVSIDHWQTDVCPHQGPSVSVSETGAMHVTWFTQGSIRSGLYYAHALPGAQVFSEPMPIGNPALNPSRAFVLSSGSSVWLVWKQFDGETSSLHSMLSTDQGLTWSPAQELMTTRGYSDHPLLLKDGHRVYVSWLTRLNGYHLMRLDP